MGNTIPWEGRLAHKHTLSEPKSCFPPWFLLYFLGCKLASWLEIMLSGLAGRSAMSQGDSI